ncbi:homeodomain-interacting protein kinase 4-like isoform X2 [Scomber scombrus]|uniref:Homeodomain-interacting protein kinase 4-like isoform X2 n=1 Tax=Scomber scombrus TaxID=13677 RepID=A0AAV1NUA6_SCOSC
MMSRKFPTGFKSVVPLNSRQDRVSKAVHAQLALGSKEMKTMVQTLGRPEDQILNDSTLMLLYFSQNQDSTKPAWRLKTRQRVFLKSRDNIMVYSVISSEM